MIKSTKMQKR